MVVSNVCGYTNKTHVKGDVHADVATICTKLTNSPDVWAGDNIGENKVKTLPPAASIEFCVVSVIGGGKRRKSTCRN